MDVSECEKMLFINNGVLCQKVTDTEFVCPIYMIPFVSNVSFLSGLDSLKKSAGRGSSANI